MIRQRRALEAETEDMMQQNAEGQAELESRIDELRASAAEALKSNRAVGPIADFFERILYADFSGDLTEITFDVLDMQEAILRAAYTVKTGKDSADLGLPHLQKWLRDLIEHEPPRSDDGETDVSEPV